jgi:hypothetical protein
LTVSRPSTFFLSVSVSSNPASGEAVPGELPVTTEGVDNTPPGFEVFAVAVDDVTQPWRST